MQLNLFNRLFVQNVLDLLPLDAFLPSKIYYLHCVCLLPFHLLRLYIFMVILMIKTIGYAVSQSLELCQTIFKLFTKDRCPIHNFKTYYQIIMH